jgi:hypothetical protein
VPVAIDAPRFLILLSVNRPAILLRQVTVILRTHSALFLVDPGFLMLESRSLAGRDLTILNAVGDAILLGNLSLVDVVVMLSGCRSGLRNQRNWTDENRGSEEKMFHVHGNAPFRLLLSAAIVASIAPLTNTADPAQFGLLRHTMHFSFSIAHAAGNNFRGAIVLGLIRKRPHNPLTPPYYLY